MDMDHMSKLRTVVDEDIRHLEEKERTYKGSWKKRGGVGAFMMLARKWDRLEGMMEARKYDIFKDIGSGVDGTPLAEIRDLRRYLLLIEAEVLARQQHEEILQTYSVPAIQEPNWSDVLKRHRQYYAADSDGTQHAFTNGQGQVEDGIDEKEADWPTLIVAAEAITIVDRNKVPRAKRENLPDLDQELNYREWLDLAPYYQPLYAWDNVKYKLRPEYAAWMRP